MIVIIKYNAGNICSVPNAIERLGYDCVVTDDLNTILNADKVIFPGVGQASTAMEYLKTKGLDQIIINIKKPILGICLGMQLMCNYTQEGNVVGLGIFNTMVRLFPPIEKVPHTGWNNCSDMSNSLFVNVNEKDDMYFVHSYYAELCVETIATCDYIQPFSAALHKNNFYATQFHPEKSGSVGEIILKNFLEIQIN